MNIFSPLNLWQKATIFNSYKNQTAEKENAMAVLPLLVPKCCLHAAQSEDKQSKKKKLIRKKAFLLLKQLYWPRGAIAPLKP